MLLWAISVSLNTLCPLSPEKFEFMRIRHIEIFYAVYRHKTISAAARRLNISQPAVSKALRHAEDQIGFPLFVRTGRGLVATQQAHVLYVEVSKVYNSVARVQQTSKDLKKTINGQLKISTVTGLSYEILPRTIARLRTTYAHTAFELQTLHYSDLIASLRDFDTHIGLVFEAPRHAGLVREHMGSGEFTCVFEKQKFTHDAPRVSLKDILRQEVISLNPTGPLGGKLWEEINTINASFDAVATAESCFVAKSLAACGVGVAIVDEFTARAPGFSGLECAKLEPQIELNVYALYLESRPLTRIAKAFLQNFKDELQLWQAQG